ncbi:hypothetical protein OY671_009353, partial [Metschnikowia pulcherrima]
MIACAPDRILPVRHPLCAPSSRCLPAMPRDGDAIKRARALRAFPRSAKVRALRAGGASAQDRFSKGCSMTYRKVRGSSARFAARFAGCVMASVSVASAAMAAPAPKSPPVDHASTRDSVKTLASDASERRGPSTAVEPKVLDAIIARFKQAGSQPGNKGGWSQDVPTVEVTASNVSPSVVTGAAQPSTFTRGKD